MPVPIRSRRAIHFSVIVVSDLSLTASFSLAGSPLRGRAVPLLASPTYATPPAPALRLLHRAFLQLAPIMFGSPPFLKLRQQFFGFLARSSQRLSATHWSLSRMFHHGEANFAEIAP